MKKNEGITLIALVVTIVVLLILAVISINVAFGEEGIFEIAKQAANKTAEQSDYEANELSKEMETFIDEAISGVKNNTLINPITPSENTAPIFTTQAYVSVKETNSLTIETVATDAEEDNLEYILEYGTTSSYGNTKTVTGSSRKYGNIFINRIK